MANTLAMKNRLLLLASVFLDAADFLIELTPGTALSVVLTIALLYWLLEMRYLLSHQLPQ